MITYIKEWEAMVYSYRKGPIFMEPNISSCPCKFSMFTVAYMYMNFRATQGNIRATTMHLIPYWFKVNMHPSLSQFQASCCKSYLQATVHLVFNFPIDFWVRWCTQACSNTILLLVGWYTWVLQYINSYIVPKKKRTWSKYTCHLTLGI